MEGPFGDRKKLMKRLCEKAGVRYFRFHPIRHSGASIMDGNGVPLGAIQRILGHENRRTTEIYLHSMGDSERDAMRVFEQARQKSPHQLDGSGRDFNPALRSRHCHRHGPGAIQTLLNDLRSTIAVARGSRKSIKAATISPNDSGLPISLAFLMKPCH